MAEATKLPCEHGVGVRLAEDEQETLVLFRTESGMLQSGEMRFDGAAAAWTQKPGTMGVLLTSGTYLQADEWEVRSSVPVNAELTVMNGESSRPMTINGTISTPSGPGSEASDIHLRLPNMSGKASVKSSHIVVESSIADGELRLRLLPGEHQLQIEIE